MLTSSFADKLFDGRIDNVFKIRRDWYVTCGKSTFRCSDILEIPRGTMENSPTAEQLHYTPQSLLCIRSHNSDRSRTGHVALPGSDPSLRQQGNSPPKPSAIVLSSMIQHSARLEMHASVY